MRNINIQLGRSYFNRKGIMVGVIGLGTSTQDFENGRYFEVAHEVQKDVTYWVDINGQAGMATEDIIKEFIPCNGYGDA